jgi:hypothetical protein
MKYYEQLQRLANLLEMKDYDRAQEIKAFAEKALEYVVGTIPYAEGEEVRKTMDSLHEEFSVVGI